MTGRSCRWPTCSFVPARLPPRRQRPPGPLPPFLSGKSGDCTTARPRPWTLRTPPKRLLVGNDVMRQYLPSQANRRAKLCFRVEPVAWEQTGILARPRPLATIHSRHGPHETHSRRVIHGRPTGHRRTRPLAVFGRGTGAGAGGSACFFGSVVASRASRRRVSG